MNIDVDCLYFNGCSFTLGDELELESRTLWARKEFNKQDWTFKEANRFAGLLSSYYKVPQINDAMGGGSNERILRTTISGLAKLISEGKKPFVIISWTEPSRREFWSDIEEDNWLKLTVHYMSGNKQHRRFGKEYFQNYQNREADMLMLFNQQVLMQSFLKSNNIPYMFFNVFDLNYTFHGQEKLDFLFDRKYYSSVALETIAKSYPKGPGNHPLSQGHGKMFVYMKEQIEQRYKINNV